MHDIRYALRQLLKARGFSATTILILALGIGGVSAMFTTLYMVMFRPLPFPAAERLVMGRATYSGHLNPWVGGQDGMDYRTQSRSFSALELYYGYTFERTVIAQQAIERTDCLFVGEGLFRLLGISPALGRSFADADGEAKAPGVAIVSHSYWQRHFGEQKEIGERSITIEGAPHTVIGVMPPGFAFTPAAEIWVPVRPQNLGPRHYNNFFLLGRLKDGVQLAEAQSDVDVISARLQQDYPETHATKSLLLTPLQGAMTERYRDSFAMLCGGAAAILLIACANAAGLLLARGAGREGELAVRAALGASPWGIMRVLLAEALLLALAGGILGTVLALWMQSSFSRLFLMDALFVRTDGLWWPVFGFVLSVSLLTGIAFGLLPAWRAKRPDLVDALKAAGKGNSRRGSRLRAALVAGQIALSFVLLVVAGLLGRSLLSLHHSDPGFNPRNLLTVEVPLPRRAYGDAQRIQFFGSLLESVRALPGVQSAAAISQLPLRNPANNVNLYDASAPPSQQGDTPSGHQRVVLPGYFETMGIPLLEGRDVRASDASRSPRVVVVSQRLSQRLFPGRNALGRKVVIDGVIATPWEVVGVVGDIKADNMRDDSQSHGTFYRPHAQIPLDAMLLAIRTHGDPHAIVAPLRSALQKLDARVPLSGPRTMEEVIANTTVSEKAIALCLSAFSLLAVILAAVGIHGVLAYDVAQQRRDIGIRIALGASRRVVAWSVLRHAGLLTLVGAAIGALAALGVSKVIRAALYGIAPQDPAVFVTSAFVVVLVAVLAAWLPARRATKVDPITALRAE